MCPTAQEIRELLRLHQARELAERKALLNSVPFNISLRVNSLALEQVVENLLQLSNASIGKSRFHKGKYRTAFSAIIANVIQFYRIRPNQFRSVSRGKSEFPQFEKYNPFRIQSSVFISALNWLVRENYIEEVRGTKSKPKKREKNLKTRIRITEKLAQLISEDAFRQTNHNLEDRSEVIELRDANKRPIEYRETKLVRDMRESLRSFNAHIAKFNISIDDRIVPFYPFVRIFNRSHSFDQGGRFFQHSLQSISESRREHLQINGDAVVEKDFSSVHISILYIQHKIPLPSEAYNVEFEFEIPGLSRRKVIKLATNILFNTESLGSATKALNQEIRDRTGVGASSLKILSALIQAIIQANPHIEHCFFKKDLGRTLMFVESRIAAKVMETFVKAGKPLIPIHDSFICVRRDELFLEAAMKDACREIVGKELPFK